MQPGNPRDFVVVLLYSMAMVVVALVIWLGPIAVGIRLIANGIDVVGIVVSAIGAVWAIALAVEGVLLGLLASAVHSVLIFAGLAEDPWEGER